MSPLAQDLQQPDLGTYWVGFDLDLTTIGGSIYYFTQSAYETQAVTWQGHTYTPIDIIAEGFESSIEGALPRPRLKISNVAKTMLSAIIGLNDCVGGKITRWRTLRYYLDGQAGAGQNVPNPQIMPKDIYVIDRKAEQNPLYVEWELASLLDFEGRKLPVEQVLRDYCTHTYRRYISGTTIQNAVWTDHSNSSLITCPYVGKDCWKADGTATTTPSEDACGKKLSDCRKRFRGAEWDNARSYAVGEWAYLSSTLSSYECIATGNTGISPDTADNTKWKVRIVVLPTKAFPGVGRTRGV